MGEQKQNESRVPNFNNFFRSLASSTTPRQASRSRRGFPPLISCLFSFPRWPRREEGRWRGRGGEGRRGWSEWRGENWSLLLMAIHHYGPLSWAGFGGSLTRLSLHLRWGSGAVLRAARRQISKLIKPESGSRFYFWGIRVGRRQPAEVSRPRGPAPCPALPSATQGLQRS